jgi:hypothetical protein
VDPTGLQGSFPNNKDEVVKYVNRNGTSEDRVMARHRDTKNDPLLPIEGPCYFRSCLGIAETYTDTTLSDTQIKSIIDKCREGTDPALGKNWNMNYPERIIKEALAVLGVDTSKLLIRVRKAGGEDFDDVKANATGSIRSVARRDNLAEGHAQEGDKDGNRVWDPIDGKTDYGRKHFADNDYYVQIKENPDVSSSGTEQPSKSSDYYQTN